MGRSHAEVKAALFEKHPELQKEYEEQAPRFAAISELIRARERAGISQSELARLMDVPRSAISRLESADHSPKIDTLAKAAAAMGFRVEVKFKRARTPAESVSGHRQRLTEREIAVSRLVAEGQTNAEIAEALDVSLATVKRHLNNVMIKWNCASRDALRSALRSASERPAKTAPSNRPAAAPA